MYALHKQGKCISGYKYIYKYINTGKLNFGTDNSYWSKTSVYEGIKSLCPYCLRVKRQNFSFLSDDKFDQIMRAWCYDGIEY